MRYGPARCVEQPCEQQTSVQQATIADGGVLQQPLSFVAIRSPLAPMSVAKH